MTDLADRLAGRFIVIDGLDGAGKSTQVALLGDYLEGAGLAIRRVRDPGGTEIGDRIRDILLDSGHEKMCAPCELMLYMASRAQLAEEVIRPALAVGRCVLGDRYISSTIAYQGAGGVPTEAVAVAARIAVGDCLPDLTVILDLDAEAGLARAARAGRADRVEAKHIDYHRKVRQMFLAQARAAPATHTVISADAGVEQVQEQLRRTVVTWQWK